MMGRADWYGEGNGLHWTEEWGGGLDVVLGSISERDDGTQPWDYAGTAERPVPPQHWMSVRAPVRRWKWYVEPTPETIDVGEAGQHDVPCRTPSLLDLYSGADLVYRFDPEVGLRVPTVSASQYRLDPVTHEPMEGAIYGTDCLTGALRCSHVLTGPIYSNGCICADGVVEVPGLRRVGFIGNYALLNKDCHVEEITYARGGLVVGSGRTYPGHPRYDGRLWVISKGPGGYAVAGYCQLSVRSDEWGAWFATDDGEYRGIKGNDFHFTGGDVHVSGLRVGTSTHALRGLWHETAQVVVGVVPGGTVLAFDVPLAGFSVGDAVIVTPPASVPAGVTWCAFVRINGRVELRVLGGVSDVDVGAGTWGFACLAHTQTA